MPSYHVKIHNTGRAARVIHDGAQPIRIPAGETVDAVLAEDTIKRIKAEHVDPEEPRLEIAQGEKVADAPEPETPPEGDAPAAHKPRTAHK